MVISLVMVRVLASIRVCACDKSVPKTSWKRLGSTLLNKSDQKKDDFRNLNVAREKLIQH